MFILNLWARIEAYYQAVYEDYQAKAPERFAAATAAHEAAMKKAMEG